MKTYLFLICLLLSNTLLAQQPLSQSHKGSTYRYIYQVSANEALALYKTKLNKINQRHLHTLVDSFPGKNAIPPLADGNYILLQATGNRLRYDLITAGDLQLKLINNKRDLNVMLHDKTG